MFIDIFNWCSEGDVIALKEAQGADGSTPVENHVKEEGNNDSDGYIDIDTDDCSDTASISSGASTGSTGEFSQFLLLFVKETEYCKKKKGKIK